MRGLSSKLFGILNSKIHIHLFRSHICDHLQSMRIFTLTFDFLQCLHLYSNIELEMIIKAICNYHHDEIVNADADADEWACSKPFDILDSKKHVHFSRSYVII